MLATSTQGVDVIWKRYDEAAQHAPRELNLRTAIGRRSFGIQLEKERSWMSASRCGSTKNSQVPGNTRETARRAAPVRWTSKSVAADKLRPRTMDFQVRRRRQTPAPYDGLPSPSPPTNSGPVRWTSKSVAADKLRPVRWTSKSVAIDKLRPRTMDFQVRRHRQTPAPYDGLPSPSPPTNSGPVRWTSKSVAIDKLRPRTMDFQVRRYRQTPAPYDGLPSPSPPTNSPAR